MGEQIHGHTEKEQLLYITTPLFTSFIDKFTIHLYIMLIILYIYKIIIFNYSIKLLSSVHYNNN